MKRFTRERLTEHIRKATDKLGRPPRILELAYFINSEFKVEHFGSYDKMSKYLVGEAIVKNYIAMYNLQDLVSITKRRTRNELLGIKEETEFVDYMEPELVQNTGQVETEYKQWKPTVAPHKEEPVIEPVTVDYSHLTLADVISDILNKGN